MSSRDEPLGVPPWLEAERAALADMLARDQCPQSLLVHGSPGTGRRHLVFWLAAQLLKVPGGRFRPLLELAPGAEAEIDLAHPDLLLVQPPPEKEAIPVESVRALIDFLHLKSHQGGARVVVVWPAEAMTTQAANSLLKTLEEPPAGSAIVLVATAPSNLPATVVSRCHRVRIATPSRAEASAWLERECGRAPWELLLDFAGGAPLRAQALHRAGFAARAERYAEDLRELAAHGESLVAIARRWGKAQADEEVLLAWLYSLAARGVTEALASRARPAAETANDRLQKQLKPLNIRPRLERLRLVEEMYRNRSRPTNAELQFTALLQRWHADAAGGD
jgi:DNA polymerase-3 subunit delta'